MQSDSVRLSIGEIVSNAISIGLKNAPMLILMAILWVITLWIPYLNIGTTIGLWDQLVRMGRGESISPTAIFNSEYRERIGDFFLLIAFLTAGALAGLLIPGAGTIIGLAWFLAIPLFVDRGTDPLESLTMSNRLTHGNKLTIFLAILILVGGLAIVALILMLILQDAPGLMLLLMFIIYILILPILFAAQAYVYSRLVPSPAVETPFGSV